MEWHFGTRDILAITDGKLVPLYNRKIGPVKCHHARRSYGRLDNQPICNTAGCEGIAEQNWSFVKLLQHVVGFELSDFVSAVCLECYRVTRVALRREPALVFPQGTS